MKNNVITEVSKAKGRRGIGKTFKQLGRQNQVIVVQ